MPTRCATAACARTVVDALGWHLRSILEMTHEAFRVTACRSAADGVVPYRHCRRATVTVNPNQTYQTVRGFGGMNGAGWINDLTPAQVDLAYGSGNGQIGLSILRMRIDPSSSGWSLQVPTAARVRALGGILFATPWSPPA